MWLTWDIQHASTAMPTIFCVKQNIDSGYRHGWMDVCDRIFHCLIFQCWYLFSWHKCMYHVTVPWLFSFLVIALAVAVTMNNAITLRHNNIQTLISQSCYKDNKKTNFLFIHWWTEKSSEKTPKRTPESSAVLHIHFAILYYAPCSPFLGGPYMKTIAAC